MHRRTVLVAVAGGVTLGGCVGVTDPSTDPATSSEKPKDTQTAVRKTADDVTTTFRVVDSHAPTDDTASATFNDETVTVTGTSDPSGCNRPTLKEVRYNAADGVIHLDIGGESPYGETATVECGNASYDYRCVVSVSRGDPEAVEVIHTYEGKDNRSFNLVQGGASESIPRLMGIMAEP